VTVKTFKKEDRKGKERGGGEERVRECIVLFLKEEMRLLPVNCMLKLPRVSFSFARVSDCKFKT
jgi:hypothetical protein